MTSIRGQASWAKMTSPVANVIKLFTAVINCHSMVITKVMWLYNTEWWYYHGMAVNYHGKKFYNIGPWWQASSTGLPTGLKSKQSWIANLSIYKHWAQLIFRAVSYARKMFMKLTTGGDPWWWAVPVGFILLRVRVTNLVQVPGLQKPPFFCNSDSTGPIS